MTIVFFGTPAFAAPTLAALLDAGHTVAAVVTQPDRARWRGQAMTFAPVKALAMARGVPVLQPTSLKTPDAVAAIRALGADLGVVAAYGKILPQTVLDAFPRGLINVHASLLPRWRGAAPIHRAIQAGDAVTGVTIMRVVLALDAGPMLARVEAPIGPDETSGALEARLAMLGAPLLVDTVRRLATGPVEEVPQDQSGVTYAARLEKRHAEIDWSRSAAEIHNQIRGLHPWPLAHARWRDRRLILRTSGLLSMQTVDTPGTSGTLGTRAPGAHPAPGTLHVEPHALYVTTGDGLLELREVQLEGKRPQSARDFVNGAHPLTGDRLTPVDPPEGLRAT